MRTLFKTTLLMVAVLFAVTFNVHARSWRINNNANRKAHFSDINDAMRSNEVQDGDTLYLDPGCNLTTQQDVTKQVTIIGTGYFLPNENYLATISGTINLKASGIRLSGVCMTYRTCLYAPNIVLERCRTSWIRGFTNSQYAIIRECYNLFISGYGKTSQESANWTIENCFIYASHGNSHTIYDLYKATLINNYIVSISSNYCFNNLSSCVLSNNIIMNTSNANRLFNACSEMQCNNNVMSCAETAATDMPNNLFLNSTQEQTLFTLDGTNDQRYELKEDSPAKGAANDGGDCGPSGGEFPYVCSGFPFGIPQIKSNHDAWSALPTDVFPSGHTITLNGAVVTFGSPDDTANSWTWHTNNQGLIPTQVPSADGTLATIIKTFSSEAPFDPLPTHGCFFKIEPTTIGTFTIGGIVAVGGNQPVVFASALKDAPTTITAVNLQPYNSAVKSWSYNVDANHVYYFFELAYPNYLTGYRFTVQSLSFAERTVSNSPKDGQVTITQQVTLQNK